MSPVFPKSPAGRFARCGFTLIELAVVIVIAVIGIAMFTIMVSANHETARKTQCLNNLKQLVLGALEHEQTTGSLPTGGWGDGWIGDPDKGLDWKQPGGWVFNVLPSVEQQALHDLQSGKSAKSRAAAATLMLATPIAILCCPSRRQLGLYPSTLDAKDYSVDTAFAGGKFGPPPTNVAKSDYACNEGDRRVSPSAKWPSDAGPIDYASGSSAAGKNTWRDYAKACTGVIFAGSHVRLAEVTDGASNTYLIGEKYLDPDNYSNGQDEGDKRSAFAGDNEDLGRWGGPTVPAPRQDRRGNPDRGNFGSAHPTGFGMALCDGSVRVIDFSIDLEVHRQLANRADGQVGDAKK